MLIDFGSASYISQLEQTQFEGTMLYCPPEFVTDRNYQHEEAAVWSLGILLFNIVTGDIPFSNEQDIVNWKDDCPLGEDKYLSQDCLSLIRMCLKREHSERIKLKDILKHSWFHDETDYDDNIASSCILNSYDCSLGCLSTPVGARPRKPVENSRARSSNPVET